MERFQHTMSKAPAISPKGKLQLLQACDQWRNWDSLNDKRYCIMCEHTFSGREVRITLDGHGDPVAHCPTPDCSATPREWLYPGNPLTDDTAWQDWLRILDELSSSEQTPVTNGRSSTYIE